MALEQTPAGYKARFSMLREEHYVRAQKIFGTDDFDRLFVVHAPAIATLPDLQPALAAHRIHWLTVREVIADLAKWYGDGKQRAALRHTLMRPLASAGWLLWAKAISNKRRI